MKLKYKILWIEDKEDYYDSVKDEIIEIVNSYGFDINEGDITYRESESDFKEKNYFDYDIMLIDWDLGSEKGNDIINDIRTKGIYNEILFYSQNGGDELREIIAKEKIEGVFCSGKKELIETFENIFEVNVRKILDLNNLRGLVMAEVSDLDELKTEILKLAYKNKIIGEEFFNKHVFPSMIEKLWENLIKIKKYSNHEIKTKYEKGVKNFPDYDIEKFFSDFLFNIEYKINSLTKLIKEAKLNSKFDDSNYRKDIQRKRNKLAHVVEEWVEREGKKVQILKNTDFEFNRDEVKKIFVDIKKYKKSLNELKDEINSFKK